MSYIKQNFVDGNPLYADELNHIEDGIKALENEINNISPEDGFSPIVTVSKSGIVTTINITDVYGTKTVTIYDGVNGATPNKGTDYWTEADKEEIIQEVITALGTPVFGRVDENNNIILTGELAEGTYTVKYENEDGTVTDIGSIDNTTAPAYTNKLPLAINADGTPYNNGQGWKTGYRLNSSGNESALDGMEVTGFIPVKHGDYVYMRNVGWKPGQGNAQQTYLWCYDANKNYIAYALASGIVVGDTNVTDGNGNLIQFRANAQSFYTTKQGSIENMAYIRLNCEDISNNSIITVNEPIE